MSYNRKTKMYKLLVKALATAAAEKLKDVQRPKIQLVRVA